MTINRRRFLTTGGLTLGLGGALPASDVRGSFLRTDAGQPMSDNERIFAETPYLASLGLPRSWESVRRGLHPFSPDRVAILPILHPPSEHCLKRHAERMQEVLRSHPPDVSEGFWTSDSFRLYVEVSQVLDMYYPGMSFENYLTALVAGEQFYGLLSTDRLKWLLSLQFRWANTPRLANPPVDWWLFLLREPFAIEGFECAFGKLA